MGARFSNDDDGDDLCGEEAEKAIKLPHFRDFGLEELRIATNDFLGSNIVSERGGAVSNVVYRGLLEDGEGSVVAVKRCMSLQIVEMVEKDNIAILVDSTLKGHLSDNNDAAKVIRLIMHCLQKEPRERPSLRSLVATLCSLQKETNNVPSCVLMARTPAPRECEKSLKLSPLVRACSALNSDAIHDILVENDEGIATEATVTSEVQMRGDSAFRARDFSTAIDCYTEMDRVMMSPPMLARRCVCYLTMGMPQEALADAMRAQVASPSWHVPLYLQSAALLFLRMDSDAHNTLTQGCALEQLRT